MYYEQNQLEWYNKKKVCLIAPKMSNTIWRSEEEAVDDGCVLLKRVSKHLLRSSRSHAFNIHLILLYFIAFFYGISAWALRSYKSRSQNPTPARCTHSERWVEQIKKCGFRLYRFLLCLLDWFGWVKNVSFLKTYAMTNDSLHKRSGMFVIFVIV